MMTDRNGKPLKVGDKVEYQYSPSKQPGVVTAIGKSVVLAHFIDQPRENLYNPRCLTLVEPEMEPKPEPVGYKSDGTPIGLGDLSNNSMFGGIPVVTYEAVPKDEVWLVDTAKITEYLNSEEGQASIKEAFADADKAAAKLAAQLMASPKIDRLATMVEGAGTNVFEALGRDNAAELYAKAELVSRVRDIMGKFERARFPEIADEILKAVADYHEQA